MMQLCFAAITTHRTSLRALYFALHHKASEVRVWRCLKPKALYIHPALQNQLLSQLLSPQRLLHSHVC